MLACDLPVVPAHLRDRILRGECVEFADSLPEAIGTDDSEVMELDVLPVLFSWFLTTQRQQPTKRHIHDIGTWVKALTTYSLTSIDASPHPASDLAYQTTIIDANVHYYNDAWLMYDQEFCLGLATMPNQYSWWVRYSNMWQSCLTSRGRSACQRCSIMYPLQSTLPFEAAA